MNPSSHAAPADGFHAPRVAPQPGHAFAGIWRLTSRRFFTLTYWLVLAGMLAALVVFSLPATSTRENAARDFLSWTAGFYICFIVPILGFILAASAMRDELGAASVDYVFTRPVRRPLYVVFRFLAHVAVIQIDFLFALLVVTGIGLFWQVPGLASAIPVILLGQVAALVAYAALGFLCGLLTSRYVIVGLLYAAIVEVGIGNVPTQLNQISLVRHLVALVRPLFRETGWTFTPGALAGDESVPAALAVLAGVAIVAVAICAAVFSQREFAGSGSRDA